MTLQQLRYLIAIAECGSISAAANQMYVSQSSLSVAVKEIERETGVTVFERSNRGITLTSDGVELLGYARQVVEQADLMELRYAHPQDVKQQQLSISTQHYAFCVEAFIELVEAFASEEYRFILRETRTGEIIDDVREFRSDLGILYLDNYNSHVLERGFSDGGLLFTPLFRACPHVFVGEHHPLAGKEIITVEELSDYPRYAFEQGTTNSFYFSEEPLSSLPHKKDIVISDRGTLSNLLANHNGYTISTGILSSEMHNGIVAIPLDTEEQMTVGYLCHKERRLGLLATRYIECLEKLIATHEVFAASVDPAWGI